MPYGDRTGPSGAGPRTGRGLGYCGGSDRPGYVSGPGGGFWGRGGGRGHRNWYYGTGLTGWERAQAGFGSRWYGSAAPGWGWAPTKDQQIADLKAQAEGLQNALDEVQRELGNLEAEADE